MIGDIIKPLTRSVIQQTILSPGGLNPAGITNQELNLDAMVDDSIKLVLGKVQIWEDVGGTKQDATQFIVNSQPTKGTSFGKPGVLIDTTDDYMILPFKYDWNNLPFTVIFTGTKLAQTGVRGAVGNRFGAGAARWWALGQTECVGCSRELKY